MQVRQILTSARAAMESGDAGRAESLCAQVLARDHRNPEALFMMGCALYALHRRDEAISHLERCAKLDPRSSTVQLKLGEVQSANGNHNAALSRFDKALRLERGLPEAICGKARVFERKGQRDRVASLLGPIVEAGSETASMAVHYARWLEEEGKAADGLALIERHLQVADIAPNVRRELLFLQGKIHERAGDFDAAFAAYEHANAEITVEYDHETFCRRVDELIGMFTSGKLALYSRAKHGLEEPVLVVGMPRTGSTLVERIIDAHPAACGLGEIPVMVELIRGLSLKINSPLPYPQCIRQMDPATADEVGRAYVKSVTDMATRGAARIVDKYLGNYACLGLIALIVPNARIIDCRRDPVNTCLSCFGESLDPYGHPYASDLVNLGRRYGQYRRLMDHWREVLDIAILELQYEELIAHQEGVTRRLIDFLGLPWHEDCLHYYQKKRAILTLSREQVDKPIYAGSVDRADRFGPHLEPLRTALSAEA